MKFHLIAVIAAVLITTTVSAQHANFGIKGGVNFSNIHNDNEVNYNSAVGLHFGLLAHFHISDKFAMQPELVFSMQGAKASSGDGQLNLNYVNVPLLFQYMFNNGFRLQAGPQIGVLVSAKAKNDNVSIDVKDDLNGVDLGGTFGMSYVNPDSNLGFDARYNHGLTNMNKEGTVSSYNRGFQLGVFYLFKHKN